VRESGSIFFYLKLLGVWVPAFAGTTSWFVSATP
jgi:hypothetical protein